MDVWYPPLAMSINRIRLEFKEYFCVAKDVDERGINRIRLEFKDHINVR